jgi:hypothetical protein
MAPDRREASTGLRASVPAIDEKGISPNVATGGRVSSKSAGKECSFLRALFDIKNERFYKKDEYGRRVRFTGTTPRA